MFRGTPSGELPPNFLMIGLCTVILQRPSMRATYIITVLCCWQCDSVIFIFKIKVFVAYVRMSLDCMSMSQ